MANIIIKFFNMKKQFLNLGKALNKAEQKSICGGWDPSRCYDVYYNICESKAGSAAMMVGLNEQEEHAVLEECMTKNNC
jgi:hypothetical protein